MSKTSLINSSPRSASPPVAEPTMVTPHIAAEWLKHSRVNRNRRADTVEKYARDMRAGNWAYTGDPIKFSECGELLDGQHRLAAIVQSGCTVMLPVLRGLAREAQKFMDVGDKRSAADTLQMLGYSNAALIASTAKIAICMAAGDGTLGRSTTVSNSELEQWVLQNPEMLRAVEITVKHAKHIMCPPSMIAFSSWFIYLTVRDWEPIESFWDSAASKVGLAAGDPVIALTNKWAIDKAQRKNTSRHALLSAIVRTWNYRRQGKPMTSVRYESPSKDGGLIPVPEVIA